MSEEVTCAEIWHDKRERSEHVQLACTSIVTHFVDILVQTPRATNSRLTHLPDQNHQRSWRRALWKSKPTREKSCFTSTNQNPSESLDKLTKLRWKYLEGALIPKRSFFKTRTIYWSILGWEFKNLKSFFLIRTFSVCSCLTKYNNKCFTVRDVD